MRLLIYILFTFISNSVVSQTKGKISYIGDSIKNKQHFFISDIHGIHDSPYFEYEFTKYANEQYGISNVVIEMGVSAAYLCNKYLQDGDSTILKFFSKSTQVYLKEIKRYNDSLIKNKFTFYGIDFEGMTFVIAVQKILNGNNNVRNTKLYKYINDLPDTVFNLVKYADRLNERMAIYKDARRLFRNEQDSLKRILGKDDFYTMKCIFENPSSEKHFQKRDKRMLTNLNRQSDLKHKAFTCILGGHHTNLHSHKSFLSKYIHNNKSGENTLVTMICKNCYASLLYHKNYFFPVAGPNEITSNDSIMSNNDYYSINNHYVLVCQNVLEKDNIKINHSIDAYYVFFKDQIKQ